MRAYEADRDLLGSVENKWGSTGNCQYNYANDDLGRRTSVVYNGNAFAAQTHDEWGYNARSELVSSMRYENPAPGDPNHPEAALHRFYDYDPIGNRVSSTNGTDPVVYYCANELNQYETLDGAATCPPGNPDESFTHDADGNLTQDGDLAYTWDAENRLARVEPAASPVNGDKKLEFAYDYMGRRVEKKVSTHNGSSWGTPTATRFIYYNWLCLVEYDIDGGGDLVTAKKFTWGLDLAGLNSGGSGESTPIEGAAGIGGLLATRDVGQSKNYVHFYDGNGNVTQLIDRSDGSIDAAYEYDAYGNIIAQLGVYANENAYRFSTRVFDAESGKYVYPYRIYDPQHGRWFRRDPIRERGGINLYSSHANRPADHVDFLGLHDLNSSGDSSQACCLYNDTFPYGRGTLSFQCYKTERCSSGAGARDPRRCCKCAQSCPPSGSLKINRRLVSATRGACCFCTLTIRRGSWAEIFPHHQLELACPDFTLRVERWASKNNLCGDARIIGSNSPSTLPVIEARKNVSCVDALRLRAELESAYPRSVGPADGHDVERELFPFNQCRTFALRWYRQAPGFEGSPCE